MKASRSFLIDQMFDRLVVAALRNEGYDVVSVSEIGMATADDAEIMQRAIDNERTVITLDEHFGDWSVLPLSRHPGVIRLKANPTTTESVLALLLPFLSEHAKGDLGDRLIIVRKQGIRWIHTAR